MSKIANWYSGKNIFVTGVTGYIGKVLVEKLLRTCPDIGIVYLMVRDKKGLTAEERKNKIFENILFSTLKSENPKQLEKVHLIIGSLSNFGLNLSSQDEKCLTANCNIVFHIAASVQFDKSLHGIAETNVFGLRHILDLSLKMNQLKSFIFCSTAFSLFYEEELKEQKYAPPMEEDKLWTILNNHDENIIDPLTPKILGKHANTYAFTKCIAENLVSTYAKYFPIAIVRPSIVCQMRHDPLPGWTEGVNGFNGWEIVAGFGIFKCLYANDNFPRCVVPVDIVSNSLIIISNKIAEDNLREVQFFNAAEDIETAINNPYSDFVKKSHELSFEYPFEIMVMNFNFTVTTNKILFKLMEIWYHYIVGAFYDMLLILFRREPMLIRVHRKIIANMAPVQYYITNPFVFKANKFNELANLLNDHDRKTFPMSIVEAVDDEYCRAGYIGVRTYLLKQDPKTIPRSRKIHYFLYYFGRICYVLIGYWILKMFYNKIMLNYFN